MIRALILLVFAYLATIGATWNGVMLPDFQRLTLILMILGVVVWLAVRLRRGWKWHPTALDSVILLWVGAFALSMIANPETTRRSMIGLWYVGLYIGLWYTLHDLLANRALPRDALIGAFLTAGFVILLFGYLQVWNEIRGGGWSLEGSRPVSLIGNTNALAAFLLALMPFTVIRLFAAPHRPARIVMSLYAFALLVLLFLTFSRGGWLGAIIALAALFWLWSRDPGSRLGQFYRRRKGLILVLSAVLLVIGAMFILDSLSISGRGTDLRLFIWESALKQFAEKPISGQGLFTFGRDLALNASMPPINSHSHAHHIVLNIAAEMGLVGLLALLLTAFAFYRAFWKNWREADTTYKAALAASAAGFCGLAAHHLVDLPAMMPLIALIGLLLAALSTAPANPTPIQSVRRGGLQSVVLLALWITILAAGFWSSGIYRQFIDSLRYAVNSADFRGAAQQLENVILADPLPIYHQQQAFLWGMAAAEGDLDSAQKGAVAFERFLADEPAHASSWANLAALYWQLGEAEKALSAIERAVELAPDFALFAQVRSIFADDTAATRFEVDDRDLLKADTQYGPNMGQFQFLRQVIPRQFLPQLTSARP